jgi:glycosyltransferase involved in cell wall biosynthesis
VNADSQGIGRYGALFARALSEDNDEDISVLNQKLIASLPANFLADFNFVEISSNTFFQKVQSLWKLWKMVDDFCIDIIHDTAGSTNPLMLIGVFVIARIRNVPLVVTEHDPQPHVGMGISLKSRVARFIVRRFAQHILVHGPVERQFLIDHGVNPARVTVIRHGELAPLFSLGANEVAREHRTILFFGAMRPNKGIHLLMPIADQICMRFPDARFLVAGSSHVSDEFGDEWRVTLQRLLNEMRKKAYFEVHDRFIPDGEVAYFFKRAGFTLLPYLEATQSGVAMIAMPFGSVVVATAVGDLPYTIQDGVTGFLASPDVEDIVEKMVYALSHDEEVEKIRQRARDWVESECSWERVIGVAWSVYRHVAGRQWRFG